MGSIQQPFTLKKLSAKLMLEKQDRLGYTDHWSLSSSKVGECCNGMEATWLKTQEICPVCLLDPSGATQPVTLQWCRVSCLHQLIPLKVPEISLKTFYEAVAESSSEEIRSIFLGGRADVGSDPPKNHMRLESNLLPLTRPLISWGLGPLYISWRDDTQITCKS